VSTRSAGLFAALVAALVSSCAAAANNYPARPVTIVVAATPGGSGDVLARILARRLNEVLHRPFIIENRPGANGNIAAEQVARAAPDGHTLLMGNTAILATNAALYKRLSYDPHADFVPISLIGTEPNILVVNPSVPAKSMAELIGLAKASPGTLNFASSGHGTAAHLAGELFEIEAKINIVHVAYKSAAVALHDVIAGHVQMMFAPAATVFGLVREGKVRALAVTTPRRTAVMPDIATVDELGIKGFDATTWHGLVAPAGTPKEIVDVLNFATVETLKVARTRQVLTDLGIDIVASTPKEFEAHIKSEAAKWLAVIRTAGIHVE
jgi:tripartite-type tricarboxylate transporter receptor subunit TctC